MLSILCSQYSHLKNIMNESSLILSLIRQRLVSKKNGLSKQLFNIVQHLNEVLIIITLICNFIPLVRDFKRGSGFGSLMVIHGGVEPSQHRREYFKCGTVFTPSLQSIPHSKLTTIEMASKLRILDLIAAIALNSHSTVALDTGRQINTEANRVS